MLADLVEDIPLRKSKSTMCNLLCSALQSMGVDQCVGQYHDVSGAQKTVGERKKERERERERERKRERKRERERARMNRG